MKDIFEIEIEEGDRVAFNPPKYKGLALGVVIGFTPKMVKIRYRGSSISKEITTMYPSDVAIDMNKRLQSKDEFQNV